jgi:hypothetical protein
MTRMMSNVSALAQKNKKARRKRWPSIAVVLYQWAAIRVQGEAHEHNE